MTYICSAENNHSINLHLEDDGSLAIGDTHGDIDLTLMLSDDSKRALAAALLASITPAVLRIHSKDINHLTEDLDAALRFALGDEYVAKATTITLLTKNFTSYRDSQTVLRDIKHRLGAAVFGKVLLYSMENQTSLSGHAASISSIGALVQLGMTVADLEWPNDSLHPLYRTQESRTLP